MSRDLRTTLAIMIAVLIVGAPLIFADAPATQGTSSYLALIFQDLPPTPIPTPIPPAIETLVIQLSEMKSGYVLDLSKEVTNAEAANTYHDPKAAAQAFRQQGRETSWFVRYISTDYLLSDAVGVSNQVYRYLTVDGATQGHAYMIAEILRDDPDFRPFNISTPCCPTFGFRRTFKSGNFNFDEYDISIQVGRYVTDVQVIGLAGSVRVDRAIYYAQLALNHVYGTPQIMQATDDKAVPASMLQPGTIDAALTPR